MKFKNIIIILCKINICTKFHLIKIVFFYQNIKKSSKNHNPLHIISYRGVGLVCISSLKKLADYNTNMSPFQ